MIRILILMLGLFVTFSVSATDNWLSLILAESEALAPELKLLGGLSFLSLLPVLLIATTAFTRIVIVLSMLRHALGLQQSPPNIVIITLALFLTLFTMSNVYQEVNDTAIAPYLDKSISLQQAITIGEMPIKTFMLSQTSEENFELMIEVSNGVKPQELEDVSLIQLIPAFLLSELTTAFKIAFVIFLPFLAIDLIVASTLMSLGMIMVPPITVALPLKIMLFVLIDGWGLLAASLLASFN